MTRGNGHRKGKSLPPIEVVEKRQTTISNDELLQKSREMKELVEQAIHREGLSFR